MDRLSISELTTYRWSFDADVQNCLKAGISALGVWRQKLSDFGEERGIELLRDSGLSVSSLSWGGGFTGSDGRSFKDSVADGCEAVRLAASMGAGCLILYTGARGGHTHNHARRLIKSALGELAQVAAGSDVTLVIEPMHAGCAADWTFLTSLAETTALIDEIDVPNLMIAFDTYHLGQGDNCCRTVAEIAPRVGIVQLGDSLAAPNGEQNRCRIGDGNLPLRDLVTALVDGGYDGFYEVELLGEEVEELDYHELIAHSKQAFRELMGPSSQ